MRVAPEDDFETDNRDLLYSFPERALQFWKGIV